MVYREFIKPKYLFLFLYGLCVTSLYYIGYSEFDFYSESFGMEWILFNFWFISPYIIGIAGVVFLGFSNVKSWLVNLASLISCCVMAVWIFYIGKTDHSTGMEVLIFVWLPMEQLPFIFIFSGTIYFIGFVVRIFNKN